MSCEPKRKLLRWRLAHPSGCLALLTPVDEAVEEGSGGDYHRFAQELVSMRSFLRDWCAETDDYFKHIPRGDGPTPY